MSYYDDGTVQIHHGDARELLAGLKADVIVTDPPYGLEFMGKEWDKFRGANDWGDKGDTAPWKVRPKGGTDPFQRKTPRYHAGQPYQAWCTEWATAALDALPPGGWLLAFGGTRTWHRLACGVEDAGFEVRDTLMWLYGSGFPKGKACLKPGWEPILLARKPGSNVLQIDACRIGGPGPGPRPGGARAARSAGVMGRWPSNVALVHAEGCQPVGTRKVRGSGSVTGKEPSGPWPMLGDFSPRPPFEAYADPDGTETVEAWDCSASPDCPVALLDQQSGHLPGGGGPSKRPYLGNKDGSIYGKRGDGVMAGYPDKGSASRFYYTAKAGRSERVKVDGEAHPTVKPLALMRWLVRLVTPPGGTVLDPFCGSGSTLVAAAMEGFQAVGVEADERWCEGSAMRLRVLRLEREGEELTLWPAAGGV